MKLWRWSKQMAQWFGLTSSTDIYLLKFYHRNTRTRCEICSELMIKTPERRQCRRSSVFIFNFEDIAHLPLVFLLSTLNMQLPVGLLLHVKGSKFRPPHFWSLEFMQKQLLEVFYQKAVLKNFAIFSGKHVLEFLFSFSKSGCSIGVFLWILRNF